jgi:hypothetical protein
MHVRMTVDDASAYLEGLIVDYVDEETSKASIFPPSTCHVIVE